MVRVTLILTLLVVVIVLCEPKDEIVYEYKDIVIKRVDKSGKTIFYYNEISRHNPKIWAEYSGINSGFSGYLVFEENGKVSLLSGDGYFQTANDDTTKFEYRRIAAYERPELSENVYLVDNSIRFEKERNKGSLTKVKVTYPEKY